MINEVGPRDPSALGSKNWGKAPSRMKVGAFEKSAPTTTTATSLDFSSKQGLAIDGVLEDYFASGNIEEIPQSALDELRRAFGSSPATAGRCLVLLTKMVPDKAADMQDIVDMTWSNEF